MTDPLSRETAELLLSAVEVAFAEQVGKLFAVLVAGAASDEQGALNRFAAGIGKTIYLYETAREMIGPAERNPDA
jgi:hypothetical protein